MKRTSQRSHEKKRPLEKEISSPQKKAMEAIAPIQSEDLKRDITDYGEVGSAFNEDGSPFTERMVLPKKEESLAWPLFEKKASQGYQYKEGGRAEEIQGGHEGG